MSPEVADANTIRGSRNDIVIAPVVIDVSFNVDEDQNVAAGSRYYDPPYFQLIEVNDGSTCFRIVKKAGSWLRCSVGC